MFCRVDRGGGQCAPRLGARHLLLLTVASYCVIGSCQWHNVGARVSGDDLIAQDPTVDSARDDLAMLELEDEAIKGAVARAAPSVVRIETLGGTETVDNRFLGGGPTTGLIVSEDGLILSTEFAFLHRPSSILVHLPTGDRRAARIVARDKSRRLAVLKVDTDAPLPLPRYVEREELQVGQRMIAVGRTFAPESPNLSVGILSATSRVWGRAIQTDAKVSPSNYGGPLIDLEGRVAGILVPLSPSQNSDDSPLSGSEWYDAGVGFAAPLSPVLAHLDRLRQGIDLSPGKLGISLTSGYRLSAPAEIERIFPGTPAEAVGLVGGDRFESVDGIPVATIMQFQTALGPRYAGESVTVTVRRNDEAHQFQIELMDTLPPYGRAFLGILPDRGSPHATDGPIADVTTDAEDNRDQNEEETGARQNQTAAEDGNLPGVVIRHLFAGSGADSAKLTVGDQIAKIDGVPVPSVGHLVARMERLFPGERVTLTINTDQESREVEVETSEIDATVVADLAPHRSVAKDAEAPRRDAAPNGSRDDNGEEAHARGEVVVRLPDQDLKSLAYLPRHWSATEPLGLLVVFPAPGTTESLSDQIAGWKELCELYGTVVMIAQPSRSDRWLPAEAERVLRAAQWITTKQAIAKSRFAVCGSQGGGDMAYLVGFRYPRSVAGIATLDATLPFLVEIPANRPGQRTSMWIAQRGPSVLNPKIVELLAELRARKYPVTNVATNSEHLDDTLRRAVIRWLDQLDRI